ncbi:MAG TPA: hypothetical protein PKM97_02970 [Bacteroidia bacterium]|nr:hypothetical protein [Bacteroidia bacterium]
MPKTYTNTMLTGIIVGTITPVLSFLLYVIIFRPEELILEILDRFQARNVLSHVISLSVIPNLLVFFLFLWSGKERSAYGVIGATLIYAMIVAGIIFI